MKKTLLCLLLFPLCHLHAQQPVTNAPEPSVDFELRAGTSITHFYRRLAADRRSIEQRTYPGSRQAGYQLGLRIIPHKKRFTPLLDVSLTRNIGYLTVWQQEYSNNFISSFSSQAITETNLFYLRWDVTRVNMGLLFQAALGSTYDIRLLGGFEMNGLMINRTQARYNQEIRASVYDPVTGQYTNQTTTRYTDTKLLMQQFGFSLCGGVHLPVIPGSRWGFELFWRYSLNRQQQEFNLAQRSTELSVSYRLSK